MATTTALWDLRFLQLARMIAGWSKDPSTQVGSLITDPSRRIISTGYNGLPRGVLDSHDRLHTRATKYAMILHAEDNALLHAHEPLHGATLYAWPLPPCARCTAKAIQVGIHRLVSPHPDAERANRWGDDIALAAELAQEAGVTVTCYPLDSLDSQTLAFTQAGPYPWP